ncbi:beta-ketoacyl reductase, partial [Nocardia jiangsuensis]
PVVSDRTGELLTAEQATSVEYWVSHVRDTVQFSRALTYLADRDVTNHLDSAALLRGERALLDGVARVFTAGIDVDWAAVRPGRRVPLPTYAFQHRRYWLESTPENVDAEFWRLVESGDADEWGSVREALTAWRSARLARTAADSWRYRVQWRTPVAPLGTGGLSGTWLLVTAPGHEETAAACVAALRDHGATPVTVDPARDSTEWPALLGAATETPIAGVLSLLGLLDEPLPGTGGVSRGLAGTLELVRALGTADVRAPLWCVTRGAVSVGDSELLTAPVQAMVWGFGRVVALEHPERWGGLIDLPESIDTRAGRALGAVLSGTDGEDQVAIRSSGTFLRRLVPAPAGPGIDAGELLRGTVLITGGTGALGAHIARWAAANGAQRLLLLSRRGPAAPGATELVAELTDTVPVRVAACDVTDRAALAAVLAELPAEHPLTTVVHAAGVDVHQYAPATELDLELLAPVVAAKLSGATALAEVLEEYPEVGSFVLFSSAAGVWGGGGQGAYSAANAYLDALAEHRRGRGLPATAIAWGPWAQTDGAGITTTAQQQMERRGLPAMAPESALDALYRAIANADTALTVADVEWERFHASFALSRPRPLLHDIPEVGAALREAAGQQPDRTAFAERLAGLGRAEQQRAVLELVRAEVAEVLGHGNPAEVDLTRASRDLGFDSLTAVQLSRRLQVSAGLRLPATLIFDYPTFAELAAHIHEQLTDRTGELFALLEQIEGRITDTALDATAGMAAVERLAQVVTRLRAELTGRGAAADTAARIEEASDDEIFELLDLELE